MSSLALARLRLAPSLTTEETLVDNRPLATPLTTGEARSALVDLVGQDTLDGRIEGKGRGPTERVSIGRVVPLVSHQQNRTTKWPMDLLTCLEACSTTSATLNNDDFGRGLGVGRTAAFAAVFQSAMVVGSKLTPTQVSKLEARFREAHLILIDNRRRPSSSS